MTGRLQLSVVGFALLLVGSGCTEPMTATVGPDPALDRWALAISGPMLTDPSSGEAFYLDVDGTEYAYRNPGTLPELMDAQQITWTFWIKTAGVSGRIGGVHGVGDPNRIWWFEADDSGRELMIVIFNPTAGTSGTGEPVFRVTTGAPFNQEWQFVIVQFDGTRANPEDRLLVWVNSALVDLVVPSGFPAYPLPDRIPASANAPFEWGRLSNNGPSFVGKLGEVAIVRRILADAERDEWFYGGIRFDASQVAAGYAWRRNLDDKAANQYDLSAQNVDAGDFGYTLEYPTIEFDWCVINPSPDCSTEPPPPNYDAQECLAVAACSVRLIGGEEHCACDVEGIAVNVTRPDPYSPPPPPPPPPDRPDPPGWTWPDPSQYGDGDPRLGQPEQCSSLDPESCTRWKVSLSCPTGIVRGQYGDCEFSIEPSGALAEISAWTFSGSGFTVQRETGVGSLTWGGTLVASGRVQVDFVAEGSVGKVVSEIKVVPRTDGKWNPPYWGSQITFVEGEGNPACDAYSRPVYRDEVRTPGARLGWAGSWSSQRSGGCLGQQIQTENPAQTVAEGSGPNQGIWYVTDLTAYVKSTSMIHPGAMPNAPAYVLTDTEQAAACRAAMGLPAGTPVAVNFYTFNQTCASVPNWANFLPAAWNHERQHFLQVRDTLLNDPNNHVYTHAEKVLEHSDFEAAQAVSERATVAFDAMKAFERPEREPSGNWSGNYWWIWWDDAPDNLFIGGSWGFNVITPFKPKGGLR